MYWMLNARKPPKLNQEFENIRLQASARIRKSVGSEGFKRMRFRYRLLWKLRNMRFQKYPDSCDRGLSHHWVTQTCIVFVFVLLVFYFICILFFYGSVIIKTPPPRTLYKFYCGLRVSSLHGAIFSIFRAKPKQAKTCFRTLNSLHQGVRY